MTMKRTDLAKNKMLKSDNAIKIASKPDRFGSGSAIPDRKEQRKADAAAGLIPFACKLNSDLIGALHAEVAKRQTTMNELVAELLSKSLKSAK
jgi:hypothetical protein